MERIKILKCFFEEPNRWYHLREYARINKISASTSLKYLNELYKNRFLKKKKEHNLVLYRADEDSEKFRDIKIFWSIQKIRDSGILDFLEGEFKPKCIILFGSISKGLDNKDSDIDLFLMSPVKKEVDIKKFDKLIGRKIQLFVFNQKELISKKELANNILNGIILRGYLDIF